MEMEMGTRRTVVASWTKKPLSSTAEGSDVRWQPRPSVVDKGNASRLVALRLWSNLPCELRILRIACFDEYELSYEMSGLA
jgi:hypothetical protein